MPVAIKQALFDASALQVLGGVADSGKLDAELLLADVLDKPREYLFTWPEYELSEQQMTLFQELIKRRQQGEPIAYIIGRKAFWDFELAVNSSVLVPRPETEILVETAISLLPSGEREHSKIADLGTGSGAIALALAKTSKQWSVVAVDNSAAALAVAKSNAANLQLSNIEFIQASWCDALKGRDFDMIVSNPPYVAQGDAHLLKDGLQFEPRQALVSADDGLRDLELIAKQSKKYLRKGAWLLMEHGFDQAAAVAKILQNASYNNIQCKQDLSGLDRVSIGQWNSGR